jgi:hypothetical protein
VDARLHHLQGEAGLIMQPQELRNLLTEFAAERLALLVRHEAGARVVSHYDFNNAYQYVIAREETQVTWLQGALEELDAALPPPGPEIAVPPVPKTKRTADPAAFRGVLEDDATRLAAFVERWRTRVESMTHARHRTMLGVIIGESVEHERLFRQAASGLEDVIGRRAPGSARVGAVLCTRWME